MNHPFSSPTNLPCPASRLPAGYGAGQRPLAKRVGVAAIPVLGRHRTGQAPRRAQSSVPPRAAPRQDRSGAMRTRGPEFQPLPCDCPLGPVQPTEEDTGRVFQPSESPRCRRRVPGRARCGSVLPKPRGASLRAVLVPLPAGRYGLLHRLGERMADVPARTRTKAVFAIPSFMAKASAVTKPMPRM